MQRVEPKLLDALFESPAVEVPRPGGEALAPEIGIDDFRENRSAHRADRRLRTRRRFEQAAEA